MTLANIPDDAPWVGDGPLYTWDAAAGAWVSFRNFPAPVPPYGVGDRSRGQAGDR